MTTTFCVLVEEIEAKKAILRVYLNYLDWEYLPRARPFFLIALSGAVSFAGSALKAALGKGWLEEEFLQTRAPDFIHSVRELKTTKFPMKKGFKPSRDGSLEGLPARLVELRVRDERWLSHLSVGQRLDTTAYELDELRRAHLGRPRWPRGRQQEQNRAALDDLVALVQVDDYPHRARRHFAEIKSSLRAYVCLT